MKMTSKMVEYTTDHYRIQVDYTVCDKSVTPINQIREDVTVFDKNNNIVVSFDSFAEAEDIANELLQVLKEIKHES